MTASMLRTRLLIVALALCASDALAQDPSDPVEPSVEPPAEYTDLIEEGLSESSMQHWAEARAVFRRAHALFPNARTLRAIGMTSYELRDYPEAYRMFVASLSDPRRPLTEAQRAEVQSLLDRTVVLLGRYALDGFPDGATIRVDGVETMVAAGDELVLATGTHRVEIRAGDDRWFGEWTVQGGEHSRLPVTHVDALAPLPASTRTADDVPRMSPGRRHRVIAGASTMAAGVVIAGAGGGLSLRGRDAVDRVDSATVGTAWSSVSDDYEEGPRKIRIGLSLIGIGAVAIGGGLALTVIRPGSDRDVALRVGPGSLSTEVRF